MNTGNFNLLCDLLVNWYHQNARDLPWRSKPEAYNIWVSEIILQQTQMRRGIEYYLRFITQFPDIFSLAEADESDVLLVWQGLGYYSRARNMLLCAQKVAKRYNGVFPPDYHALIDLKGIGDYTACAILSIAYNKPFVVADGNVIRLITRLFAFTDIVNSSITIDKIKSLAFQLMGKQTPSVFNQALMDFGALICKPANPLCVQCPLNSCCLAFSENRQSDFPVKKKNIPQKRAYFHYIVFTDGSDGFFVTLRTGKTIWRNLWEFPLIETVEDVVIERNDVAKAFSLMNDMIGDVKKIAEKKHILTHIEIFARLYIVKMNNQTTLREKYIHVDLEKVQKLPIHNLMKWCCQKFESFTKKTMNYPVFLK